MYSWRALRIPSHSKSFSTVCPDNPVLTAPSGVSYTRATVVERITEQPEPSSCSPTKIRRSMFATLFPHRTNFGSKDPAAVSAPHVITIAAPMVPTAWIIASAFEVAILPFLRKLSPRVEENQPRLAGPARCDCQRRARAVAVAATHPVGTTQAHRVGQPAVVATRLARLVTMPSRFVVLDNTDVGVRRGGPSPAVVIRLPASSTWTPHPLPARRLTSQARPPGRARVRAAQLDVQGAALRHRQAIPSR